MRVYLRAELVSTDTLSEQILDFRSVISSELEARGNGEDLALALVAPQEIDQKHLPRLLEDLKEALENYSPTQQWSVDFTGLTIEWVRGHRRLGIRYLLPEELIQCLEMVDDAFRNNCKRGQKIEKPYDHLLIGYIARTSEDPEILERAARFFVLPNTISIGSISLWSCSDGGNWENQGEVLTFLPE